MGMRNTTSKVGAVAGAAAMVAGAALAFGTATAGAEPEAGGQVVRYTLTSGAPYQFQVFYLTAQPASKDAYNADAYAYAKRETITVGPDAPWVVETTLADPQWAILRSATRSSPPRMRRTACGARAPSGSRLISVCWARGRIGHFSVTGRVAE